MRDFEDAVAGNRFALSVLRYLLRLSPGSSQQSNPGKGIC